ncbi:ABC-three component system middle component 6 [Paenibacillus timonensis]|uniref:ABC-three component system middle component 6 n=1 Tax=Paenibacillus timonensis TaxID=225915 RepID=UPI003F975ECC
MIINSERKPALSLYFLGSEILKILIENKNEQIETLFELLKKSISDEIHIDFYYYSLDWLYLLSIIRMENGRVLLCE